MAIQYQNCLDTVRFETFADLEDYRQKCFLLQRERAFAVHPMRRDAHRHGRGHHHLRIQSQGCLLRHQCHTRCIVDHRQVFIVLLSAAGRQDDCFENAPLKRFAKLLSRAFPEQRLAWIDVSVSSGLDIGEDAPAGESSEGSSG